MKRLCVVLSCGEWSQFYTLLNGGLYHLATTCPNGCYSISGLIPATTHPSPFTLLTLEHWKRFNLPLFFLLYWLIFNRKKNKKKPWVYLILLFCWNGGYGKLVPTKCLKKCHRDFLQVSLSLSDNITCTCRQLLTHPHLHPTWIVSHLTPHKHTLSRDNFNVFAVNTLNIFP